MNILGYTNQDFETMPVSEFFENFEISLLIADYLRGNKLELNTSKEAADRISRKIKKFREQGLL